MAVSLEKGPLSCRKGSGIYYRWELAAANDVLILDLEDEAITLPMNHIDDGPHLVVSAPGGNEVKVEYSIDPSPLAARIWHPHELPADADFVTGGSRGILERAPITGIRFTVETLDAAEDAPMVEAYSRFRLKTA